VLFVAHYISIVIPLSAGGWRALFPDVPDCAAEGDSLDITVFRAAGALSSCVATRYSDGKGAPAPRPLSEIKADGDWATAHHVDWAKAVVTMVPLHAAHDV
jgi:predicted RNase H-like HicB family nuclease